MKKKRSNLTGIIISMLLVLMMVFISACNFGNNSSNNNNNEQVLAVEAQNGQDDVLDAQDVNVEEERDDTNAASVAVDFANIKVGDVVVFGEYQQDLDTTNGNEPIEWEVLDVSNNRALLLSKYVIECKAYNEEVVEFTWETCSLRSWLNGEFYDTAFDEDEKHRIAEVTLSNPDNAYYGTEGGNDTNDKIFLLSMEEIFKYYGDDWYDPEDWYSECQSLRTPATVFVKFNTSYNFDDGADWYLRTPGDNNYVTCGVDSLGRTGWGKYYSGDDADVGIRPALYVEF